MADEQPTIPTIEKGQQVAFLRALAECGNVSRACKQSGVPRWFAYECRKDDEEFAKLWDHALKIGIDALEDEAIRRAYEGVEKPLMSGGRILTDNEGNERIVREYSDTLLIFLLKGRKPEVYKDRVDVSQKIYTVDFSEE